MHYIDYNIMTFQSNISVTFFPYLSVEDCVRRAGRGWGSLYNCVLTDREEHGNIWQGRVSLTSTEHFLRLLWTYCFYHLHAVKWTSAQFDFSPNSKEIRARLDRRVTQLEPGQNANSHYQWKMMTKQGCCSLERSGFYRFPPGLIALDADSDE